MMMLLLSLYCWCYVVDIAVVVLEYKKQYHEPIAKQQKDKSVNGGVRRT
jgi:hypothetical protein